MAPVDGVQLDLLPRGSRSMPIDSVGNTRFSNFKAVIGMRSMDSSFPAAMLLNLQT